MWKIDTLVAVDDETGGRVRIDDGQAKITIVANSVAAFRRVKLKDTPPCLSAAIDDLLKFLAEEDTT